jgi:hypothetical protein
LSASNYKFQTYTQEPINRTSVDGSMLYTIGTNRAQKGFKLREKIGCHYEENLGPDEQ